MKLIHIQTLVGMVVVLLMTSSSFAMSVSWEGSTAVMTNNQPFLTDWLVAYSFRSDMAIAARYMNMTMRDSTKMQLYAPQFDYLVRRWNDPFFQANIYASAGFGAEESQGLTSAVSITTLEADIESRVLYAATKFQANIVGRGPDIYQSELRLGVAPYKADYEDLASWLIVSLQSNPQLIRTFSVTPMVRLFYKSVLVEIGASAEGDWMFNSMIHF
jgi:hypothetical protein